jgi:hypothetical protein
MVDLEITVPSFDSLMTVSHPQLKLSLVYSSRALFVGCSLVQYEEGDNYFIGVVLLVKKSIGIKNQPAVPFL